MNKVFSESLYKKQYKQFEQIREQSKSFAVNFCGNTIIRDSIFEIVLNYARKKGLTLEILRYPIKDEELWAFTFIKKGIIFMVVNSNLSLCKQFFATAHELYHVYCYAENVNTRTITGGSLLDSNTADDIDAVQEDIEANAFAGLLLMPDEKLIEQFKLFGISREKIGVDDILILMELFALPYKAVVLRLVEGEIITESTAQALLNVDSNYVAERIELTGRAQQWQQNSKNLLRYGSLLDIFDFNKENELLTNQRVESDFLLLEELKKDFRNER